MILSFYGRVRVSENAYSRIFYGVLLLSPELMVKRLSKSCTTFELVFLKFSKLEHFSNTVLFTVNKTSDFDVLLETYQCKQLILRLY